MFLLKKAICHFLYQLKNTNVEYGGSGLNAIFANKLNLFNFKFLKMIKK
jgi:predicted NAD/FAD-binding protein